MRMMGGPRQVVLLLERRDGSQRRLRFEGYERISIGSDEQNDVVLSGDDVAAQHATLLLDGSGLRVAGGSEQGTWLEGRLVQGEQLLLPGEALQIGAHRLSVEVGDRDTTHTRLRAMDDGEGTRFGRYELLELLGRGGMAEVYLAADDDTGRVVALKRILPALREDSELRKMFADEGRIATQLDHPGLCRVFEVGSVEGHAYLTMEICDGEDLRRILARRRQLPVPLAVQLVARLCATLQYVHEAVDAEGRSMEIVHRNVVPANVMIGRRGDVKLLDFGIARARQRHTETPAGVLKGVLGYLAPEMVRGEPFDWRIDIFAAGVLLYDLLTGHEPFSRESAFETLEALRNADFMPPSERRAELSRALEDVIYRALALDPDDRYQSAGALAEALLDAEPAARDVSPDQLASLL